MYENKSDSYSHKEEPKPVPESKVSLKYMAWNVKEMTEHMKTLTLIMKSIEESIRQIANSVSPKSNVAAKPKIEELPF